MRLSTAQSCGRGAEADVGARRGSRGKPRRSTLARITNGFSGKGAVGESTPDSLRCILTYRIKNICFAQMHLTYRRKLRMDMPPPPPPPPRRPSRKTFEEVMLSVVMLSESGRLILTHHAIHATFPLTCPPLRIMMRSRDCVPLQFLNKYDYDGSGSCELHPEPYYLSHVPLLGRMLPPHPLTMSRHTPVM